VAGIVGVNPRRWLRVAPASTERGVRDADVTRLRTKQGELLALCPQVVAVDSGAGRVSPWEEDAIPLVPEFGESPTGEAGREVARIRREGEAKIIARRPGHRHLILDETPSKTVLRIADVEAARRGLVPDHVEGNGGVHLRAISRGVGEVEVVLDFE